MITVPKLTLFIPDAQVDEKEILKNMFLSLKIPDGAYEKEDGNLYIKEDISYHGSPQYEEKLYTSDQKRIRKYKLLKELIRLYN